MGELGLNNITYATVGNDFTEDDPGENENLIINGNPMPSKNIGERNKIEYMNIATSGDHTP